jgi:hypothetical protein
MWFRRRDKRSMKESQQAILDATKSLREVRERDPEVHAVSRTLKDIRERNHFAERLRMIMEGG